jgi:hypothetical protein
MSPAGPGVPARKIRQRRRAELQRASAVCDHLQAAMFHLANDRGDLARRSIRTAIALYSRIPSEKVHPTRELERAVTAATAWMTTPQSYRTLVAFCHATVCLVEWRSLRFSETRYTSLSRAADAS